MKGCGQQSFVHHGRTMPGLSQRPPTPDVFKPRCALGARTLPGEPRDMAWGEHQLPKSQSLLSRGDYKGDGNAAALATSFFMQKKYAASTATPATMKSSEDAAKIAFNPQSFLNTP